jgi:NTE family protein
MTLPISRTLNDKHNIMAGIVYETTTSGTAPVQDLFRGGGFFRMSGFEPNELTGQHFGVGLIGYRYRLADIPLVPPYIGTTIEYGNATDDRDDIVDDGIWNGSIYAGVPSFLGPVYLGYGWQESDDGVWFLRIGSLF